MVAAVSQVLSGHEPHVALCVAAMLARGHVLLEDVPGVGKTTLARAMANVAGASFSRIQFTADMLPSDLLGVQLLDGATGQLVFRPGPLFAAVVLADEINRASPKTQSAMLEAMEERRVTVDDKTYPLPDTFLVLATQNPLEHHGAYPLPESQLDRFMVRLHLGYPARAVERELICNPGGPKARLAAMADALDDGGLAQLQGAVQAVALHPDVADYLLTLVAASRSHSQVALGVSPRGALALAQMARAWALMAGREFVVPEDVRAVAPYVMAHRLTLRGGGDAEALVAQILAETAVPR